MLLPFGRAGRPITLVSPDELSDDTWTCSTSSLGGRDPDVPPPGAELAAYGLVREKFTLIERMARAATELAEVAGVRLGAIVSVELGSAATVGAVLAGMALGIPIVDSDYVGRAKPEVGQSKMDIHGLRRTPIMFVDRWGNTTLVKSTVSERMTDRIGRMVSMGAYGQGVGAAGNLVQIKTAKVGFVRGSLLTAIQIGRALRTGLGASRALGPLLDLTHGRVLFTGEAIATDWESDEPYTFRTFTYRIAGTGDFSAHTCRVWVKNEHHVVWRGDEVVATSPDIIAVLDAATYRPLSTRGDVTAGRRVIVFGMSALDPDWYTPRGLELLGPRHFGFDFDHVPVAKT